MTQSPVIVGYDGRPQSEDARALGELLAAAFGAETRLVEVDHDSPARELHELAVAEDAEVVVLGSTHRGALGRIYPGSVAERLLSGAPCAVAVAPRGYAERPTDRLRVVQVGFDGSSESRRAIELATRLALNAGATMRVCAAFQMGADATPLGIEARERLGEDLRAAVATIPAEVRALAKLVDGEPVAVLTREAEAGADLLVLGSRGYGPLGAALLGGVSGKVIRGATVPVLVVPRRRARAAA